MQSFTAHRGRVAALPRTNVDTDQIIPKQFLKRIERTGFGPFLFYDWRFDATGKERSEFELNQPAARGATILLTGANFGCGSSREHAPWALQGYGLRAIIAPSFADIFYTNCCQNGLLPVPLSEAETDELFRRFDARPGFELTVDLGHQRVWDDAGFNARFEIASYRREMLMQGLDEIARTLLNEELILAYERCGGVRRP
jgi:3-isopropylmalate/(R)-2-methylmalate dehydratase small subunit